MAVQLADDDHKKTQAEACAYGSFFNLPQRAETIFLRLDMFGWLVIQHAGRGSQERIRSGLFPLHGKADHVPVVAGGDEIGLLPVRFHHSAQDEAAQPADPGVGIGQIHQQP